MAKLNVMEKILKDIPAYAEKLRDLREIVLANTVMIGEIPAPTFGEERRIRFLCDRFTEAGLQNISTDEAGNGTAIFPGKKKKKNILVCAHADTVHGMEEDHTITVNADSVTGSGVADNSLGLATLASLPTILEKLNIELEHNLVLLGTTKSLGKGDLQGLRFFLENRKIPITAGLCIEGVHLGRLSYSSLGMLRGEIMCSLEDSEHESVLLSNTPITVINKIITRILAIPTPHHPRSEIILGSVSAGQSFNRTSTKARLRFEVRSEQTGMVRSIADQIAEIVDEIDADDQVSCNLEIITRRAPGGIRFGHPLVKSTKAVMKSLGIKPKTAPSVGELAAMMSNQIPAITLGVTKGGKKSEENEIIHIDPIFNGIAQILGVLLAIDKGACNE